MNNESIDFIEEVKGDLFKLANPEASLAHCVSQDLAMGKGIAVQFKHKFGRVEQLRNQNRQVGQICILQLIKPDDNKKNNTELQKEQDKQQQSNEIKEEEKEEQETNRYVYNLVTKARYFGKPTMNTLIQCLQEMKAHALKHGVKEIAMPRLGCGLDRLNWSLVKKELQRIFSGTEIRIVVCEL